jgi:hypothetical protein
MLTSGLHCLEAMRAEDMPAKDASRKEVLPQACRWRRLAMTLGVAWSLGVACPWAAGPADAQIAPTAAEAAGYGDLHASAWRGDAAAISQLLAGGASPDARDGHGRTPLHVATFKGHHDAVRALIAGGADTGALENDRYDAVTIAAVADD